MVAVIYLQIEDLETLSKSKCNFCERKATRIVIMEKVSLFKRELYAKLLCEKHLRQFLRDEEIRKHYKNFLPIPEIEEIEEDE